MPQSAPPKLLLLALLLASLGLLSSCDESTEEKTFDHPIATGTVAFTGEGRIFYRISAYGSPDTISKPRWTAPDLDVEEVVLSLGTPTLDEGGQLYPELGVAAVYTSGSTPVVTLTPLWRANEGLPEEGTYTIKGTLIDAAGTPFPLFAVAGELALDQLGYVPIQTTCTPLKPYTAKLYTLRIESTYTIPSGTFHTTTNTHFITTLRAPLPGVPLLERVLRWSAMFIDGTYEEDSNATWQRVAEKLFAGLEYVESLGHRYGGFPRPQKNYRGVEVFLDFPTKACGEMARFFMAMVESHGIDANKATYNFIHPSPTTTSMYETYDIPAMGTSSTVWRYQNHAVVEVNGRVYDPTYMTINDDVVAHEDWLFERFCYGEETPCGGSNGWCTIPSGPQGICIPNQPGFVEGESPSVLRYETY